MPRRKIQEIDWRTRFDNREMKSIVSLYKKGYGLKDLCSIFNTDIPTIIEIIRKSRFKKKILYKVYEKQEVHQQVLITEKDRYLIEKFFPTIGKEEFKNSYFQFWFIKFSESQKKKSE